MADEQVTGRPQQIVLDLKWTEDGQDRHELFGPWTRGTEHGGMPRMLEAFLDDWQCVTGCELGGPDATGIATAIVVNDPDEWLRARQQAQADAEYIKKGVVPTAEMREDGDAR